MAIQKLMSNTILNIAFILNNIDINIDLNNILNGTDRFSIDH